MSHRGIREFFNESLRHYNKPSLFQGPNLAYHIIIQRPLTEPQLFVDNSLQEVVTSQLYVVSSVYPILGKLICFPREFDYLILVVCVSNKNNKT